MRRIRLLLLSLLIGLSSVLWWAAPAAAQATPAVSYYLSLGDSLAQGVQPLGPGGANTITDTGYPDQLLPLLQQTDPSLQLVKIGCPGESTTSMLDQGQAIAGCVAGIFPQYGGARSQLDAARWFMNQHPGAVRYLTVDIGANDVVGCLLPTGVDPTCLQKGVTAISANLPVILSTLQGALRATGQHPKLSGMTYYDPGLGFWSINQQVATQSVGYLTLVNGVEAVGYLRAGLRVAPVAAAFQTYTFSTAPGASRPVNVEQVCTLTWMCTPGVPPNIHAKDAGYELIADTFGRTLRW